jgi:hypothetical protein
MHLNELDSRTLFMQDVRGLIASARAAGEAECRGMLFVTGQPSRVPYRMLVERNVAVGRYTITVSAMAYESIRRLLSDLLGEPTRIDEDDMVFTYHGD